MTGGKSVIIMKMGMNQSTSGESIRKMMIDIESINEIMEKEEIVLIKREEMRSQNRG